MSYREILFAAFIQASVLGAAFSASAQQAAPDASALPSTDAPATQSATFRITPTPNVGPSNTLAGVKTISPTEVWAVGSHGPVDRCCFPKTPVSLRWNGSQWIDIPLPVPAGAGSTELLAVDGTSSTNVWAVGTIRLAGQSDQVWLLRWNGVQWNTVATVSDPVYPGYGIGVVTSLTVVSETDVWVVGARIGGYSWTLHWDGLSVQTVPSPNLDSGNRLNDVDAINSNEVWAVGSFMVIRYNGAEWLPVPNAPRNAHFSSIQAIAPNDIWATATVTDCPPIGGCSSSDDLYHFDGTEWTLFPVPGTTGQVFLKDLSASASDNIWLVGSDAGRTFVAHFDGTSWGRVASENTPPASSDLDRLNSVSALNADDVWAVGDAIDIFYDPHHREVKSSLALRRVADPSPIPTAIVSRKLHGNVSYDIDLPLTGSPGIECRSGGATNDYQVVLMFDHPVTFNSASLTSGSGSVGSTEGNGSSTVVANLTGITSGQILTLAFAGMNDGTSVADIVIRMAVLVGDTNGNGVVNASDLGQTKARAGQSADAANFRDDVNANGFITGSDVSFIKSQVGSSF